MEEGNGVIGKSIRIKGNLTGGGDLIVEGQIEGHISLKNHLTIESSGKVDAEVRAEKLTINGEAKGNLEAGDLVEIKATATVSGEVKAPRLVIEDGARFNGSIEMDVQLPDDIELPKK